MWFQGYNIWALWAVEGLSSASNLCSSCGKEEMGWSAREVNIYNPGLIIPIMSPWASSRRSVEILSGRNLFVPVQQLFTNEFWELLWEWWWCTTSRALELCIHHDHLFWLLGVSRICCPLVINPSSVRSVGGNLTEKQINLESSLMINTFMWRSCPGAHRICACRMNTPLLSSHGSSQLGQDLIISLEDVLAGSKDSMWIKCLFSANKVFPPITSKMLLPLFWSIVCRQILLAAKVMAYAQNFGIVIYLASQAHTGACWWKSISQQSNKIEHIFIWKHCTGTLVPSA